MGLGALTALGAAFEGYSKDEDTKAKSASDLQLLYLKAEQDRITRQLDQSFTASQSQLDRDARRELKEYEIQNTSIHFGDIYGPNDNRDKLIPYIKKNEDSNEIVLNSDGNGFLSPVFIEDALDSIINELILDNEPRYSLQTSASELLLVKDFVEEYKKIRKKDFEVRYLDKVQPKYSETTKFQPSTKLKYPLEKGLKLI